MESDKKKSAPTSKPTSKPPRPGRPSTYPPLRNPGISSRTVKQGEPFDPEELYRRLERHCESEKRARERRRARAAEKAAGIYHHVPKFAASDFVKTATPELYDRHSIHPLSRPVVKGRNNGDAHHTTSCPPRDAQFRQIVEERDLALQKMMAVADRNQFQQTKAMKDAAQMDNKRSSRLIQRDFEISFLEKKSNDKGDVDAIAEGNEPERLVHYIENANDRPDWEQTDQVISKKSEKASRRRHRTLGGSNKKEAEKVEASDDDKLASLPAPRRTVSSETKQTRRKSSFLSPFFKRSNSND
ncbi:MAG: hypothetical protein MMC33_002185 [Icmadophila ericetorum]|nr:hypothetical protein [Icmadophila ericetorum]